jgi:glycosyltransferase involved in cell wall biosynthesis
VADAVRFAGNIPPLEVARWLQAADVFALGTAREGCCNAVLEALAVGAPVVTTPVGDNAYFVRDGVNGRVVPVDDAGAMATAISAALTTDWDRPGIARALAQQAGSWDGVGQRVLEFMNERLTQHAAPQRASA